MVAATALILVGLPTLASCASSTPPPCAEARIDANSVRTVGSEDGSQVTLYRVSIQVEPVFGQPTAIADLYGKEIGLSKDNSHSLWLKEGVYTLKYERSGGCNPNFTVRAPK